MSKAFRIIPALGAVFFVSLALSACGGGIPGNAVVQVNGKSITKATFEHWMGVAASSSAGATTGAKPAAPVPPNYTACIASAAAAVKPAKGQKPPTQAQLKTQCEQQYKTLQQEVLGFLISSEWVIGETSSLGVKASDKEVKAQFEKIKNQQFPKAAEFEKFLASSGQTVSDLLLRIKAVTMLPQKIEAKVVKDKGKVTQAQIAKYYKENQSRFGTPEKRSVEIILTKAEAAAKSAKKEIESGKSFASVAKKVSIDPTSKASGGLLKEVIKGQEEKSLDTAIFSAKAKVLSGPVKTPFGYYVFEVLSSTPGSQRTLAQSEASIKQQLTATQQQSALTEFIKAFKKKWTAKTDCRAGFVVKDCKQFKEPKTPALPAGATGTPQTGGAQQGGATPPQTTKVPVTPTKK